jgi:hypothetical protein
LGVGHYVSRNRLKSWRYLALKFCQLRPILPRREIQAIDDVLRQFCELIVRNISIDLPGNIGTCQAWSTCFGLSQRLAEQMED